MEVPKSSFSLVHILIQDSSIKRKPVKKAGDYKIKITPTGKIFKSKKQFEIELKVVVWEQNKRFKAEVVAIGLFAFSETSQIDSLDDLFYVNAPAIIFPYIRSYISALTALSGMEAITLPTMNLTGILNDFKQNTIELE